jgi:hypothetical protein
MTYFIFLKSLRSLEEFRKNPHVKIRPKYSCANFQSLAIFKNLIFIQKGIFFGFQPIRPSPAPRWPALPRRPPTTRSAHSAQAALAHFPKGVFSSTLRTPAETPSLSHITAMWGPHVSPSPSSRRPIVAVSPRCLRPPRAAQLHPRMLPEPLLAPPSSCLLIPPLNLAPVFNGVKAINTAVNPPGHPSPTLPQPL